MLLDALEALAEHRSAVILAGAQAIYVRTGAADLDASVAPYTKDADLALDPRVLGPDPQLEQAMQAAGFYLGQEPGIWTASTMVDGQQVEVPVDLLVPATMVLGNRSARLPDHGDRAARRTPGLEAAVADQSDVLICSLEPEVDARQLMVPVAGTAALLVAKAHKLHDRIQFYKPERPDRLQPKDAGDVLRLMQAEPADQVGRRLAELAEDETAGMSVREGMQRLQELFGRRRATGVDLAVQALQAALPEVTVRTLSTAYLAVLTDSYTAGRSMVEPA
ncbi:hypothetical protein D2L64_25870 [Micromonospora radicis]|uniref:Nucleotidyltransferase n=1 Tax=Micromonospora radicis TaxID=1894971 RepID=A0A418MN17_9ACTN|nr:hypothetical protein D2L64_25870 [Micromonospora radicis]